MTLVLLACAETPRSEAQLLASARAHLARGDAASATIDLKTLLSQHPESGEGRAMLGKLLLERGDAAGARIELERAAELKYSPDNVLPPLAEALLAVGEPDLLIQRYASIRLSGAKAAADFLTSVAQAHQAKGAMPAAEAAVGEALQLMPTHAPAQLLRVRLHAEQSQDAKAQSQLDALLAAQPQLGEAWALQGELFMSTKPPRRADAIAAYRKALAVRADLVQAHSALVVLLLGQGDLPGAKTQAAAMKQALPGHPEARYIEALLALQAGEHLRVRELTQALLAKESANDVRVLTLAGQAETALNSAAKAEALLARAVQLAPKAVLPRQALAQFHLGKGQGAQALAVLTPLFDAGLDDGALWLLKGRAHLVAGDVKAAEQSLTRAARLRPNDRRIQASVALLKLGPAPADRAITELGGLARTDSGTAIDLVVISTLMSQGKAEAARQAIDLLAQKGGAGALPDLLRARVAMQQREPVGARKHFEAGLAKEPQNFALLSGLSALDIAEGRLGSARSRFETVLQQEPTNVPARLALADVVARAGGSRDEVAQVLQAGVQVAPTAAALRAAVIGHWLAAGQPARALSAAKDAVAAMPDNADLLERLGRLQAAQGEHHQALNTFRKLVVMLPGSAMPHLRIAELHMAAKDDTATSVAVRAALQAQPDSLPAQRAAIRMAMRENKPEQALVIAREVQRLRADEGVGHVLEGEIQFERRQFDAAAAVFRQALAKTASAETAIQLHRALLAASKPQDAQRLVDQWLKSQPADVVLLQYLGDAAQVENRAAAAEAHYREAIRRAPDNVLALNNLAHLLTTQRKPGALAFAERAVQLAPNVAPALDTLATAYANNNQLDRALQTQRRAVELAPGAHAFRLGLARLQLQSGDHAGAREELRKLMALGKEFREQEEVSRLLKAAGG